MDIIILISVVVCLILSISVWKLHPFLALLGWGFVYGIASGVGPVESINLLLEGFANTLKWIALIMIFGAMIGEIANETGGARCIAQSTMKAAGKDKLPAAMGFTGYIISIPVFVDVAYIMMQSVTEALAARSRKGILVVGLSLVAGLTATHALMPPTPGPLAVAGILEANLGHLILINAFVSMAAMAGGLAWAVWYCRKVNLPYDQELQKRFLSTKVDHEEKDECPNLVLALLPILVPLILIALRAFLSEQNTSPFTQVIGFLGIPLVAIMVGVLLALLQYGRALKLDRLGKLTERSIEKAALVIVITGAGGAFGHLIRSSGITDTISSFVDDPGYLGFLLPFILASVFTTTTGSLTVSMITTASIIMPFGSSLGISPAMTAALIGSGSFCVFHINSSFFWLLNRLHKIPPTILLRTYTLQSLCMGLSGLLAVIFLRLCGLK